MRPMYRWDGADLELDLHAQPGARRTEAQGALGDALKIRIAAPPEDGAANRALLDFIADAFDVPRSRCELLSGHGGRRKRIRISAPDRARADGVLAAWLQTSS
jgi:uncharacterized protein (TIGR00251 family)